MLSIDLISNKASALIRRTGTRDPFIIAKQCGVAVRYKDLGKLIKAYYFCQSRIRNIVINRGIDENSAKVYAAHELGHDMLHRKLLAGGSAFEHGHLPFSPSINPLEYEANIFAAEILIDEKEYMADLHEGIPFFDIAKRRNVPPEMLHFKTKIMQLKGLHFESPINANGDYMKNEDVEFSEEFCF
ncbi:MAG: ImmA/IrrE family metallo-endopeptidase [Ruminococcus sp.]|jgi:Zn-dependent peptidase ImmA (M78 family)|nr:ImmA/IrrE family metallo-endopeptidase [Ruminococcus sp.]